MRFIILSENNTVVGVREGASIAGSELQSDTGELGQIMRPDGTFITPEPVPVVPVPSLEEQFESLKQDNLILMDVLAAMYEDMLAKGTV